MDFIVSLFVGIGLFVYAIGLAIFSLLFFLIKSTSEWVQARKWFQFLLVLAILFWPLTWFGLILTAFVGVFFLLYSYIRALQAETRGDVGKKSSVKQLRP